MKGPKLSVLGYKIPPQESVKPLQRLKALVKVYSYQVFTHFSKSREIAYVKFPVPIYRINVLHLFTDADDQPADDLSNVAAINIDQYLSKTSEISKGIVYNIHQCLMREWEPGSLGGLPEDIIQQLWTGVIFDSSQSVPSHPPIPPLVSFQSPLKPDPALIQPQGLHLPEPASHSDKKTAQLWREGLGRIQNGFCRHRYFLTTWDLGKDPWSLSPQHHHFIHLHWHTCPETNYHWEAIWRTTRESASRSPWGKQSSLCWTSIPIIIHSLHDCWPSQITFCYFVVLRLSPDTGASIHLVIINFLKRL